MAEYLVVAKGDDVALAEEEEVLLKEESTLGFEEKTFSGFQNNTLHLVIDGGTTKKSFLSERV